MYTSIRIGEEYSVRACLCGDNCTLKIHIASLLDDFLTTDDHHDSNAGDDLVAQKSSLQHYQAMTIPQNFDENGGLPLRM